MPRKKVSTTVYVEREQDLALKKIRDRTGIPTAVLIREAIDIMVLRMNDSPESVIAQAEDRVQEERELADQEARYVPVMVEELDVLATHARQLEADLALARERMSHYRRALSTFQAAIDRLLKAPLGVYEAQDLDLLAPSEKA